MKAIKLLVLGMVMAVVGTAEGQVNVNVQIGAAPAWGPRGYENSRYYYLPDVDAYYDRNTSMFIYLSGNNWIHRRALPARYHNYNLYRGRKVVMSNYHGNSPYYNHKVYKAKYYRGHQAAPQKRVVYQNKGNKNQQSAFKVKDHGNNKNDRNSGHKSKGNGNGKKNK